MLLVILAVAGGGIYVDRKITAGAVITGQEKCMFCTGDHYQPVSEGATVYALDSLKT